MYNSISLCKIKENTDNLNFNLSYSQFYKIGKEHRCKMSTANTLVNRYSQSHTHYKM